MRDSNLGRPSNGQGVKPILSKPSNVKTRLGTNFMPIGSSSETYQIWTEALVIKNPKVKASKRKYNRTSRFFKWQIARARSEHIAKIGKKLESYPSLSVLGALLPPLRTGNDTLIHTAEEKSYLLGALFASNSTLDDQATTKLNHSMLKIKFNQKAVRGALPSLDIHKSSGPYGSLF